MRRLLFIVAAFILYGSLYPFDFDFYRTDASPLMVLLHAWPAHIDRFAWRDAGVNVLLYFPLGLTAVLVLSQRLPRAVAALATGLLALVLSASIEMLQIYDASRTCSLLDVACNLAGALGGIGTGLLFQQEVLAITRRRSGRRGAWGGLLIAACWAGWQLYPFIPLFSRGRLHANFARFLTTPISPVELIASAAEWYAFALVFSNVPRVAAGRLTAPWLALAMCCLPLRLLIADRTLAPAELVGAAFALLIWTFPADRPPLRFGAAMLAVAIVLRELSPFTFSGPPHPMSWIPFAATLDAERLSAALVILRKAFDYGALVWLLRASGLRYWLTGVSVGAALLVLETAQRYLPNRQPELTDTVLTAILSCILWASENTRRPVTSPK